jgi:signal transduction histidine kinase
MTNQIALDPILNIRQALHDLAQPLAALTGLIDLLLLETDAADPKLREVQTVNEQLEKVLEIVGEIRRLAREASASEAASLETGAPQTQGALRME